MHSRIEVFLKDEYADPLGENVTSEIETFGFAKVKSVRVRQVYIFFGKLTENELDTIAKKLLADSVTQHYLCTSDSFHQSPHEHFHIIEISRKPGVMDPVEQSVIKALRDINISVDGVKTAHKYMIDASVPAEAITVIAAKVLANTNIEDVFIYPEIPKYRQTVFSAPFKKKIIPLINAQDVQLEKISVEGQLSLNIHEMRAIQQYYTTLRREPTDIELETIAQTWSEHCVHKTLKGRISFNGKLIDNLLKNTVMRATEELNTPWCVSVFKDNAGIIEFDEEYNVCFKVETHNHPSAIEPYGGANTGIGGVVRDIMGTGLGAKPILNTDVFCFGMPDTPP